MTDPRIRKSKLNRIWFNLSLTDQLISSCDQTSLGPLKLINLSKLVVCSDWVSYESEGIPMIWFYFTSYHPFFVWGASSHHRAPAFCVGTAGERFPSQRHFASISQVQLELRLESGKNPRRSLRNWLCSIQCVKTVLLNCFRGLNTDYGSQRKAWYGVWSLKPEKLDVLIRLDLLRRNRLERSHFQLQSIKSSVYQKLVL